jgi:hypothetical protein
VAGTVIVPWYATGCRADQLEQDLNELAAVALRYGASSYAVYRSRDDLYKFQQFAAFEDKLDWERYWAGPEMVRFRALHSSWFQVPLLYGWWDKTAGGEVLSGNGGTGGNGHNGAEQGNGVPSGVVEGESA